MLLRTHRILLMSSMKQFQTVWVKVQLSFEHIFQKYWYITCSNCFRSTSASLDVDFLCNSCNQRGTAKPRYLFIPFNQIYVMVCVVPNYWSDFSSHIAMSLLRCLIFLLRVYTLCFIDVGLMLIYKMTLAT